MLLGHYGAAYGFKAADRRISLGTLFIAANLPDIVWCVLLFFGIENTAILPGATKWVPIKALYSPFSHGIAGVFIMSAAFAGIMWLIGKLRKDRFPDQRASGILGLAVFSHILLDIPVHIPDIALLGWDGPKLGLGLWNYPVASNALELGIFIAGVVFYIRPWTADFKIKPVLPVLLFGLLLIIYHFINGLVPPPAGMSSDVLAISCLGGILVFSGIAEWVDRHFPIA